MIKIDKDSKRLDKGRLLILVDGWGFNRYFYFVLKRFIPKDYGYIHYSYPDEILNKDPLETKNNISKLINLIEQDINNLLIIKPRSVNLYGQSLGGLFCMIIADKISIQKVMLVAPGYNLAESFWLGKYTQKIKNEMIKNFNMNLENLKEVWADISPDYYFKDKSLNSNFSIILSTKDNAIPTQNGKQLIKLIEQKNIPFQLSFSKLSHKLLLLKELILIKNFRNWLSK